MPGAPSKLLLFSFPAGVSVMSTPKVTLGRAPTGDYRGVNALAMIDRLASRDVGDGHAGRARIDVAGGAG